MKAVREKRIAIIGAGPIGLAAAAHALDYGLVPVVLEAGSAAAHAVRQWGHVAMFSPWQSNIDKASARLLQASGWNAPDLPAYPTGRDFVSGYIEPLATRTPIKDCIKLNAKVTGISRVGYDKVTSRGRENSPFEIRYHDEAGAGSLIADAVIDASGTWFSSNPAGANGLEAMGEKENASSITYAMPDVLGRDRKKYRGKRVAVLGGGHSAIGTLIDLVRLGDQAPETEVIWLLRGADPQKAFGGGANDKLAARGALGSRISRMVQEKRLIIETGFSVARIDRRDGRLRISTGRNEASRHVLVDELVVATGFRPDLTFLSEMRLALDPALECPLELGPLIDPNVHSCGTVRPHGARELSQPEPGLYVAGMKSYGRAPTFLMMTGYEQVRSIIAEIAGDKAAAERVELELPETGVCNGPGGGEHSSCCDSPAKPRITDVFPRGEGPNRDSQQGDERGGALDHHAELPTTFNLEGLMATKNLEHSVAVQTDDMSSIQHEAKAEACCGGPAKTDQSACCVKDEAAKREGKAGCGCSDQPSKVEIPTRCCG